MNTFNHTTNLYLLHLNNEENIFFDNFFIYNFLFKRYRIKYFDEQDYEMNLYEN